MINFFDNEYFWRERVAFAKHCERPHLAIYHGDWEPIVENRKSVLEELLSDGDTVLDAGCGHGWLSQEIANPYVGIDQSAALIGYGRELYPGVDLRVGKLEIACLAFPLGTFDWAICSNLKHGILGCESVGSMEKGRWNTIELALRRAAKRVIVWPTYGADYEILE